ncbi:MAG: amidohydrolase family protein [Candidatus Eremiobacteraeota bacterium]|nr:amidohydrolase family protein [Candidatus Eremiobacteraeota bacterium]
MIDVHTHLHPPRLTAAIRRWFAEHSSWVLRHPTEPREVARLLREAGVTRFAFCSYAHKPGIARELNGWLTATARDLGDGAFPLATVHADDPDPAGDLRDALRAGCIGLKVHEDVQRFGLDDPRLDGALGALAAHGVFVLAHVGHIPWSDDTNDGPGRMTRVLERHPGLRIVVAHFGAPDHLRYLDLTAREPRLFLDTTMAFAPESPMRIEIARADVERGARQIVLGTDWPNIPYAYDGDLRGLRALGLDDATVRAITNENARRLSPAFA